MRKLMTLTLAVLLLGLCAAVVYAAVDAGDDSSSLGTTTESTTGTTETTTTPTETTTTPTETTTTPQGGVDISGPCDEAEHANDPRCTGAGFDDHGDDDSSGPGSGGDDDSGHGRGRGRGRGGDDD